MKKLLVLIILCFSFYVPSATSQTEKTVDVSVDFSKKGKIYRPIWTWFGYDEPNYTYMKDGKKLLSDIATFAKQPVYVRAHNLLSTGDGTPALKWGSTNAYTEDAQGNPIYQWNIVDSIFDTYVQRKMKPLVQIGFMPKALSTHPEPYQHAWKPGISYREIETGWAYPPNDYKKWGNLAYEWTKHCVERYGKAEVESWYWEVWNEPDGVYWKGSWEDFYKLYDYAADGVKRALPTAKIGGCNTTGGGMKFLKGFLDHCLTGKNYVTGQIGSPLDAVLFHAKGSPKFVNGRVVMSIKNQLADIDRNLKLIHSYPAIKDLPIIIGESDPEGCAACGMSTNPENAYRNGTMYSSYTAASFARKFELMDKYDSNLLGAVSWSFEFENQPWFAGFRDLATNGVNKPVLNVFKMFAMMKGDIIPHENDGKYALQTMLDNSVREKNDVGSFITKGEHSAAIMLWNYHDKDSLSRDVKVNLALQQLAIPTKSATMTEYRIDQEHSNSYNAWQKMGSPQNPTTAQIEALHKASELMTVGKTKKLILNKQAAQLTISLPSQAVSLIYIRW
ncbi:MAG: GH39 family glycosyl hydrolase [Spirosomataceae bacterium]